MKSLEQLKIELLADGIIDANEVKELKVALYADSIITLEGAEFLFELNNAVSGKENDVTWETLFIEAISSYLLEDNNAPDEIDALEAKWLFDRIQGDRQLDTIEKKLLLNLKKKAKSFPANLENLLK